mmetsp:Transcript_30485/g.76638  ORF Transcript_30485/g.76638 Transcript_30485/m.76638 type:complete len:296 (-) Transcript_30485:1094-1981(-)
MLPAQAEPALPQPVLLLPVRLPCPHLPALRQWPVPMTWWARWKRKLPAWPLLRPQVPQPCSQLVVLPAHLATPPPAPPPWPSPSQPSPRPSPPPCPCSSDSPPCPCWRDARGRGARRGRGPRSCEAPCWKPQTPLTQCLRGPTLPRAFPPPPRLGGTALPSPKSAARRKRRAPVRTRSHASTRPRSSPTPGSYPHPRTHLHHRSKSVSFLGCRGGPPSLPSRPQSAARASETPRHHSKATYTYRCSRLLSSNHRRCTSGSPRLRGSWYNLCCTRCFGPRARTPSEAALPRRTPPW